MPPSNHPIKTTKNSISRKANGNIQSSTGDIRFQGGNDTISTQGGDIIFVAKGDLEIGSLISNGGNISLTARTLNLVGNINSGTGNVTIESDSKIKELFKIQGANHNNIIMISRQEYFKKIQSFIENNLS